MTSPCRNRTPAPFRLVRFTVCPLVLALFVLPQVLVDVSAATLRQVDCWFTAQEWWPDKSCYFMEVPEDHARAEGRTIEFPVIRFYAKTDVQQGNPVLHLGGGGPGFPMGLEPTSITSSLWWNYRYMSLEIGRDLIVMDPRGVGMARPRLVCTEYIDWIYLAYKQNLTPEQAAEQNLDIIQRCRQRISSTGVDLSQYHSRAVAQDVELLREAMGVQQWNLYGVSYASRYALTIARDFPASVSAMVLDGAVFPHLRYDEHVRQLYNDAFQRVFDFCADHPPCVSQFGDVASQFWSLVERFDRQPLELIITDPYTYEPLKVVLTGTRFIETTFQALYDESFYDEFPALLLSLSHGNTDMVAPSIRSYMQLQLDPNYGDASQISHFCREEMPFVDYTQALPPDNTNPILSHLLSVYIELRKSTCAMWQVPPSDPIEGQPVSTDIPVLFLHGELDPVLPATDIKAQMKYYSRHALEIFENVAHDVVSSSECAEQVAGAFYRLTTRYREEVTCL